MQAINDYVIVDKIKEEPKKVSGLLLTDETDQDNRYKKANIISVGNEVKIVKKGDIIFNLSRTDLSNLLINQSTKYIGKRISTTMIRKARASVNVESKKDMETLADIMTHKVGTHAEIYTKEV